MILPPGTILQQMYLEERLGGTPPGTFIEVGAGQGIVSRTLLALGWRGRAYDLNRASLEVAAELNAEAVAQGRFTTHHADWLEESGGEPADLVVSCMVLEHLDDAREARYLQRCRESLRPGGTGVLLVPGCPELWGVEDDIAGHLRRYTFDSLRARLESHGLAVRHLAGLTYPLSNLLFPVSEFLVRRAERRKMALPAQERTELSGNRNVKFKTTFPAALGLVLNHVVMAPLHWLQKANARNPRSMVIYAEFRARA
jgi:SAM-dependent methyltransferase